MNSPAPVDAIGQRHAPAGSAARIVSLVPSLTELAFDLGLGPRIVGRTRFCRQPQSKVGAVPVVGGTKQPDLHRILAAKPTHVLVNVDETPRPVADALMGAGVRVVVTHPQMPEDNVDLFRLFGGVFGCSEQAEGLVAQFIAAQDRLRAAAAGWPQRCVLYLIWQNPWMTIRADTYIGQVLALAGLHGPVLPDDAARYPDIVIDGELLRQVDAVLFASEPYAFRDRNLQAFRQTWGDAAPVLAKVDGSLIGWYGSRAIRGLDYLRRTVPETFKTTGGAPGTDA